MKFFYGLHLLIYSSCHIHYAVCTVPNSNLWHSIYSSKTVWMWLNLHLILNKMFCFAEFGLWLRGIEIYSSLTNTLVLVSMKDLFVVLNKCFILYHIRIRVQLCDIQHAWLNISIKICQCAMNNAVSNNFGKENIKYPQ